MARCTMRDKLLMWLGGVVVVPCPLTSGATARDAAAAKATVPNLLQTLTFDASNRAPPAALLACLTF